MRIKSEPAIIGALVATYLLVCALLIINSGCAHARPPRTPMPTYVRTPVDAELAAVAVKTECGWGSGVLIDATHVLTAHHVVDCDRDPKKVTLATTVNVELVDGTTYIAAYDALDAARDLARLRLQGAVSSVKTLTVAHTKGSGEIVCAVTAVPDRNFRCGLVATRPAERVDGDIMFTSEQVWLGNSGSGLYNTDGALVGIVVSTYWCDQVDTFLWEYAKVRPVRMCGARATSIDDSPVML